MIGLRPIRLLAVVLIALAALAVVAVILLLSINLSPYRGPLEARVSEALGRPVRLNGSIRVLPSLWPTLAIHQVSIDNAAWASQARLAEVERLSVQLVPLSLLQGRVRIARVVLEGGKLHLETRADGVTNWMMAGNGDGPAASGPAADLVRLPQIEVRDSEMDYRDALSGVVTRLGVIQALLSAEEDAPLELGFDGTLRGQPLTVALVGGPLGALVRGKAPWPVRIALATRDARLTARGELRRLPEPRFDLQVHASGQSFDDLGPLLGTALPPLGPFELTAQLVKDASGYEVNGAHGYLGVEDEMRFAVESGHLVAPFTRPLEVRAVGQFRGLPFRLQVEGGPYPHLLSKARAWPVQGELRLRHTRLTARGEIAPNDGGFDLRIGAAGRLLSTLEPLVQRDLPPIGPYGLEGRLSRRGTTYRVEELRARVRQSDLRGELEVALDGQRPRLSGRLESNRLSLEDLRGMQHPEIAPAQAVEQPAASDPIPMALLRLLDGEVAVSIGRLDGTGEQVEAVRATLRLIDGELTAEIAQVRLAGQRLAGRVVWDARPAVPTAILEVRGKSIDYGPVLAALHVSNRLTGRAEAIEFTLRGEGRTLSEIWRSAALRLQARRGSLTYRADPQRPAFTAFIEQGSASVSEGAGLQMKLRGQYKQQLYTLELMGGGLGALNDDSQPWPLRASGTLPGVTFGADGSLRAVYDGSGVDLQVHLQGTQLDGLNSVLETSLPALGPYRLAGHLTDTPSGIRLSELQVRLGQSDFAGELLYSAGDVPSYVADISSNQVRLTDLYEAAAAPSKEPDAGVMPEWDIPVEALRHQDLELSYRAERFTVGRTVLTDVALNARLRRGRLDISRATGNLWQGSLTVIATLDAGPTPPQFTLVVAIEDLNYSQALGPLNPVKLGEGTAEIAIDLTGRGRSLADALASSQGFSDFYVGSGHIESRYLQLWAPNVVFSLVPGVDKRKLAEVKCAVAHFDVTQGRAETKSLLVDMDRIVIKGVGSVDLGHEQIELLLWPETRDRSLIHLMTPIEVKGSLRSPRVLPKGRGVVEDVAWLVFTAANPVMLAVNWLTPDEQRSNPCVGTQTGAAPLTERDNAPPTLLDRTRDAVRGLGRLLQRPFGEPSPP